MECVVSGGEGTSGGGSRKGTEGLGDDPGGQDGMVEVEFVDRVSKEVDVNLLRVTELPYNPGVRMPKALDSEVEVRLHQVKIDVRNAVQKMTRKSVKWGNVNVAEKRGLEKLCKRIKAKEIVCFVTDKSGRMSCDTLENYKRACEEELSDDRKTPEITMDEHGAAEKEMNAEGLALLRMMGHDADTAGDRLRNAIVAEGVRVPPLYGTRKDHKEVKVGEEEIGPRVRPVCGAEDCVTKRVSYILCLLLSHLIPESETHCWATDDLLTEFEKVNADRVVDRDWVVGSLDVDALYPSLDIERCARVVCDRLFESDLKFEKLDWKEIALYLRFHLTEAEIQVEGLERICPRRKCKKGRPKFITSGSAAKSVVRHGPWLFRQRGPGRDVVRRMFCVAIRVMIVKTMSLHDFQLDGKVYRQSSGGSIGLDLTGVVSDIYMCEWDKHLLRKIEEDRMEVIIYKRYKDDVNFVVGCEVNEAVVEGERRDRSVVDHVKSLAESIDSHLKVSTDMCSNHPDGRLPILDVKVWIGTDSGGTVRILHTHHMKGVSNRSVMHQMSSHSESMKFNVFVNEVLRILRNCSPHTEWKDEAAMHVTYFMRRMQYSGYSEDVRFRVVSEALRKYDEKVRTGSVLCGRQGVKSKAEKREWYKSDGKYDSVMFVEATPDSQLKKEVEKIVRRHKVKIRVVERVGTTTKRVLQKSNPFQRRECGRDNCVSCADGCNVDCRMRGCVYELYCKEEECGRKYRGQTGRSVYERLKEHASNSGQGAEDKPLNRHRELYHGGRNFEVGCKVLAQCYGKPSRRMINEAVYIDELKDEETMNSRREWSYVKLNKVVV